MRAGKASGLGFLDDVGLKYLSLDRGVDTLTGGVAQRIRLASPIDGGLIETRYGRRITRIRQDLRASTVPTHLAEALKVDAGSPALMIVRRYFDASDEVFEITVTIHPAERFTFSMELHRSRD